MDFIWNFLGFGAKKPEKNPDEIKVNKWDASALKNALDDSAKKWYKEKRTTRLVVSNRLINIRILITLAAVLLAGAACLYDYLYPFPASYWAIVVCASLYFLLMGVLSLFTWYEERGIIFEAQEKDEVGIDPDNCISLTSSMPRYKDTYCLRLSYTDGKSKRCVTKEFTKSVTEYFDESGLLHVDRFESDLAELHNDAVKEVDGGREHESKKSQ